MRYLILTLSLTFLAGCGGLKFITYNEAQEAQILYELDGKGRVALELPDGTKLEMDNKSEPLISIPQLKYEKD